MDLSILIVNWNTRELLDACLRSIEELGDRIEREVIVVDNASRDGSSEMIASKFPGVRLIACEENLGFAAGNNLAATQAKGRYLMLLNSDTVLQAGCLETLIRFMEIHPEAGACAPRLVNPDGSIQRSVRRFPSPEALLWDSAGLARLFPRHRRFAAYRMGDFDYLKTTVVDQPMASALVIRRAVWDEVGPFDEQFPIFFNDVDWLYRMRQCGWLTYYVAEACITHHGGASTRQVRSAMVSESHRSLEKYLEKHYAHRIPRPFMALVRCLSRTAERVRIALAGTSK